MLKDYLFAFNQLKDHRVWKPVIWATLMSSLVLILFLYLGITTGDKLFDYLVSYFDFLEEGSWFRSALKIIFAVFLFILGFFFFNSIHAGFLGIFMDDIIDAINENSLNDITLKPAPNIVTSALTALRLVLLSLLLNLIATPIFIIGWFFPPFGITMQLFVNEYLLGKEYKTTLDLRLPQEFNNKAETFTSHGTLGAVIWLVPILNLFVPILTCASVFHARTKISDRKIY